MSETLVLAVAGPGEQDGIGDYAWHLARALGERGRATLVIGRPQRGASPDGQGIERLASWDDLRGPDWMARVAQAGSVLVQYFPQAFVGPDLPSLVAGLAARRKQGRPAIVTLHEYWPHASLSPRRELMRWRSRRALRELVAASTAMVVSQPFSIRELTASGFVPRAHLHVIPVGSAIPRVGSDRHPAVPTLGIFGQPAMMDASAVRAVVHWLKDHRSPPRLHWFSRSEAELRAWWNSRIGYGAELVTCFGGLAAADLSRRLEEVTVGLALYVDGASTRRSSLAALIEHRLPIAGLNGRYTDERIRESGAFALVPQDEPDMLPATIAALLDDRARCEGMSVAAERLFQRELSWPRIAASYRALEDVR